MSDIDSIWKKDGGAWVKYSSPSSPLYRHCIGICAVGWRFEITIINKSSTTFTADTLKTWLINNGYTGQLTAMYSATGGNRNSNYAVYGITGYDSKLGFGAMTSSGCGYYTMTTIESFVDNVKVIS